MGERVIKNISTFYAVNPTGRNKKKCIRLELFTDFTIYSYKNNFSHSDLTTTE